MGRRSGGGPAGRGVASGRGERAACSCPAAASLRALHLLLIVHPRNPPRPPCPLTAPGPPPPASSRAQAGRWPPVGSSLSTDPSAWTGGEPGQRRGAGKKQGRTGAAIWSGVRSSDASTAWLVGHPCTPGNHPPTACPLPVPACSFSPTTESNVAFDASLRARNPQWGYRDVADVTTAAAAAGLAAVERREMPANNLMLVFRKQ